MRPGSAPMDDEGAVAILVAGAMALLFAFLVVVIDLGMVYFVRRDLQSAADTAAMAAALAPAQAAARVAATLRANGLPPTAAQRVETGVYVADPAVAPAARFQSGVTPANAVRVDLAAQAPLYFLRYFRDQQTVDIVATATATHIPEASFSAGTGLARLDDGLLNAVLGGLLGSDIRLAAIDYQGLLATDVNLLSLLDALAVRLRLGDSYRDVLDARVEVLDLVRAAAEVLTAPEHATLTALELQALGALQQLQVQLRGPATLRVGDLIDLGIWAPLPVGSGGAPTAVHARLGLFDLLSLSAQVANGSHMVELGLPVDITGIATANLQLAIGEVEQRVALGPVGTSLHTAQTRLFLDLALLPDLLGLPLLRLPLYVEVASGTATLDQVTCGPEPAEDGQVVLGANTGVARLHIGEVSESEMTNFEAEVDPDPATVVNVLGLIRITARANASVGESGTAQVAFDAEDIENGTRKEVSSTSLLGGLLGSLAEDLTLKPSVLGLLIPVESILKSVLKTLSGVLGLLDPLVDGLLRALGVRVGAMDLAVLGMRCGVPALVQ